MSNLFLLTFFISIICLVVFLIRTKYRKKKYLLGAVVAIFGSFILFAVSIPSSTQVNADKKEKEEQVEKDKKEEKKKKEEKELKAKKKKEEADKKLKEETEKKEKEEQIAKEQAEQKARDEQAAKEQAEQKSRDEQAAREQAEAEQQQAQQNQQQINTGITGYCKDGSPASGDPSARGKANSCYGHGGWER